MAVTLKRSLKGRRNAPLAWEWSGIVDDAGDPIDFTSAEDVRMHVRLYGAAPFDPLVALEPVDAPLTEGLVLGLGSISGCIDEVTLALLPAGLPGETVRFPFDVVFNFAGVVPEVWIEGDLVVADGVTDRLTLLTNSAGSVLTGTGNAYLTTE